MGLTRVAIKIKNMETGKEVTLIVDTGSLLTWISRKTLEELGIKPRRMRRIKTTSGEIVERRTGLVTIEFEGNEADVEGVFAEESDAEVLGVIALESLGYTVNPITNKLEYIGYIAF